MFTPATALEAGVFKRPDSQRRRSIVLQIVHIAARPKASGQSIAATGFPMWGSVVASGVVGTIYTSLVRDTARQPQLLPRACLDSDLTRTFSCFLNPCESVASHTEILSIFARKERS